MVSPFLNTDPRPFTDVFVSGGTAITPSDSEQGGWVSGNPANLAANATVDVVFDLGVTWRRVAYVSISVSPSGTSSGLTVIPSGSDTAAYDSSRRLNGAFQNAGGGSVSIASATFNWVVRPMGRYLVLHITNADATNAQGATTKATIAIFSH